MAWLRIHDDFPTHPKSKRKGEPVQTLAELLISWVAAAAVICFLILTPIGIVDALYHVPSDVYLAAGGVAIFAAAIVAVIAWLD